MESELVQIIRDDYSFKCVCARPLLPLRVGNVESRPDT